MLRPQAYVAFFVALLVIPSQRITPALCRVRVEKALRQNPPDRLNPLERRAHAGIRQRVGLKTSLAQEALRRHPLHRVMSAAVMRQVLNRLLVSLIPQPCDVIRELLPACLVIIQDADCIARELHHPDGRCVCLAACSADVPIAPNLVKPVA